MARLRNAVVLVMCILLSCVPQVTGVDTCRFRDVFTELECDRWVDVAIIGAGPAGSYAAYRLSHARLAIELFEYSNRVGGRLFTISLPNIPDVRLEMGGMRYMDGQHWRLQRVVHELNLTEAEFNQNYGIPEKKRYYIRGKFLTFEEVKVGDVPYDLSPEEKANQATLALFYLEKLTGLKEFKNAEEVMELKTKDGRPLSSLTLDEALDEVATKEGKAFLTGTVIPDSCFANNLITATEYFLEITQKPSKFLTVREGMSSIPRSLVNAFLHASRSHRMSFNKKLEAISERRGEFYQLKMRKTATVDGVTVEQGALELVCAKKVVVAIPHLALTKIKWTPLRQRKVQDALDSVAMTPANKILLTFPEAWWLKRSRTPASVMKSDLPFQVLYDWHSNITEDAILFASYTNADRTIFFEKLNSVGSLAPGSPAGITKVTRNLKAELLRQLSQAFGVDQCLIPDAVSSAAMFWSSYPFGGAWTSWRAGKNFSEVPQIIQHPSQVDDVFIVGSDYRTVGDTKWTESAFSSVDEVLKKYFS